jgi:hypothetical protein
VKRVVVIAIIATSSPSFAADPQIAIEAPSNPEATLDDARVEVRAAGDVALVRVRLGVVSPSGTLAITRIGLSLPSNARVVGMDLTQSERAFTASAMTARDAGGEFAEHRTWNIDPALLEWHGESDGRRRLLLSVSPITEAASTVIVIVAIPHLKRLELDVDGSRRTIPGSAFGRASDADLALATRPEAVTAEQSLYAGPTDPLPTDDAYEEYMRADYPQLRACYAGLEAHDAVMHFTIANGHVRDSSFDGVSEQTAACLADQVDRWTFREFVRTIEVGRPLRFVPLLAELARRYGRQADLR